MPSQQAELELDELQENESGRRNTEAQTEVAGEIPVYLRGNCQGALQPDVAVKASIILTSPCIYCICKVGVGDIAKIYTEVFL